MCKSVRRERRVCLSVHCPARTPHPKAVSALEEFTRGRFQRVMPDAAGMRTVRRVLLCTGKVFYELEAYREEQERHDTAIRPPHSTPCAKRCVARKMLLLRYAAHREHPSALGPWGSSQRLGIAREWRIFSDCASLVSPPGACGGRSTLPSCRPSRKSCALRCDGPWTSCSPRI